MVQLRTTALKSLWTIALVLATILLVMNTGATRADIILTLSSVMPVGTDFQYTYSVSLASGTQLHSGGGSVNTGFSPSNNFFTVYDIQGLIAGSEVYGGALATNSAHAELLSGATPATSIPVPADSGSVLNITTYWTGPDMTASSAPFDMGTLTFLSHNPVGSSFLAFAGATQKLEDVNLLANNTGQVAGPGASVSPIAEPSTLMLLAMALPIAGGLYYRRRR